MNLQQALVWQRADFRESSRLVTLLTREQGKVMTLAKGAHRDNSPLLGRIDFLNLIEARLTRGSLPLLHRVRLLHEHRGLRQPKRYMAASYLVEMFDTAFPPGRPDPTLFDLLVGGLSLLERCPLAVMPQVVMGVELRFLRELGMQPPLLGCARCGAEGKRGGLHPAPQEPALLCREHRGHHGRPVPKAALSWLDSVSRTPGRELPKLPPAPVAARELLGRWIVLATERPARLRKRALAAGPPQGHARTLVSERANRSDGAHG